LTHFYITTIVSTVAFVLIIVSTSRPAHHIRF
jgi:hypothetical protein